MKPIDDIIKKLSTDKLKDLSLRLNIKGSTTSKVKSALLNLCSFHHLINSLSPIELKIFKIVYSEHDGISMGDLQKESGYDLPDIEASMNSLSNFLLVYIIKNRQLLNKRMDKVYCIKEIADFFKISEINDLKVHMSGIFDTLADFNEEDATEKSTLKQNDLLEMIASNGNLVNIDKILESEVKNVEKQIIDLETKGIIKIFYIISGKLNTLISINSDQIIEVSKSLNGYDIKKSISASNSFNALINVLHTYDIISSSGLFLTKQGNFRKIDIKKLSDHMIEMTDSSGKVQEHEDTALFSMQLLNFLKGLWLEKDIGVVSLKHIADKIENPLLMTKTVLTHISQPKERDDNFNNEIEIPKYTDIKIILNLLNKLESSGLTYLKICYLVALNISHVSHNNKESKNDLDEKDAHFGNALNFIILLGLVDIEKGLLKINREGREVLYELKNKKLNLEHESKKCLIINPDFNLMIDEREIRRSDLYTLLAFTEIISRDVIMQCAITKSSIIDANKRGMNISNFLEKLKEYAKNDLPQNLEFLLEDWTNQTIRIDISRSILVHSSHSNFIDEISYSSISNIIEKRIADEYILIDKGSIDDLVKFSKKFDVVINIFENTD